MRGEIGRLDSGIRSAEICREMASLPEPTFSRSNSVRFNNHDRIINYCSKQQNHCCYTNHTPDRKTHTANMATDNSKALTKRSADTALMLPPPPPAKKIKRPTTVLEEDKYVDSITQIIARDFFPGLAETDSTQEYLDALESQDPEWIVAAGQKLTQIMTPGPDGRRIRGTRGTSMTPFARRGDETPRDWLGDTPRTVVDSEAGEESKKEPEIDTNMSLSAFQAKYTSEDNESFYKLVDKQNEKRRQKYAWLWNGNQIPGQRQILQAERNTELLEAAASSSSNDIILAERGKDRRPAMPEFKKTGPKNTFMFAPDSLEDVQQTTAQLSEARSNAPPKSINHSGTRIAVSETEGPAVPSSPALSAVDAALAGRPRGSGTDAGYSGAETPRVAGYSFVDANPTPDEEEFMRRKAPGFDEDLLSRLVGPIDSTPNPFTINDSSAREKLTLRLVDKANKNKRPQNDRLGVLVGIDTPGRTPTPKFMSAGGMRKDSGSLTPAAQNLLRRVGTPMRKGSAWDEARKMNGMKLAGVTPKKG